MRRRLLLLATAWLVLAGCGVAPSGSSFTAAREPSCRYQGREGTAQMVLIAQAVPTASQLPCVELKPAGWSVSDVFVRNGRVRFELNSDRVGQGAVQVVLQQFCALGKVTRVPSDHPGTRRYQEVISIDPGKRYLGAVYYLFPGGCVTYRLDFRSDEQARPLGEVTLALGFVPRDTLRESISQITDGKVSLDPPGEPAQ